MTKNLCRNCEKRHTTCHITCKDYIIWRKIKDEMINKRIAENRSTPDFKKKHT